MHVYICINLLTDFLLLVNIYKHICSHTFLFTYIHIYLHNFIEHLCQLCLKMIWYIYIKVHCLNLIVVVTGDFMLFVLTIRSNSNHPHKISFNVDCCFNKCNIGDLHYVTYHRSFHTNTE